MTRRIELRIPRLSVVAAIATPEPEPAPPPASNSIFICNFEGANNSTVFIDSSAEGNTITRFGNTTIQTAGGQYGLFVDPPYGGLSASRAAGWTPTSSGFTAECFVSYSSIAFYSNIFVTNLWEFLWDNLPGVLIFGAATGPSGFSGQVNFTPTIGQVYHLVYEVDSLNRLRIYINGVNVYSVTLLTPFNTASNPILKIGEYLNGKMFGVRISAFARYATDSTFAVPSLPF